MLGAEFVADDADHRLHGRDPRAVPVRSDACPDGRLAGDVRRTSRAGICWARCWASRSCWNYCRDLPRLCRLALPEPLRRTRLQRSGGISRRVGRALYSDFLVPFEISSLVLLVGAIGAIILARPDDTAYREREVNDLFTISLGHTAEDLKRHGSGMAQGATARCCRKSGKRSARARSCAVERIERWERDEKRLSSQRSWRWERTMEPALSYYLVLSAILFVTG